MSKALLIVSLAAALCAPACSSSDSSAGDSDDLTSNTALARKLRFQGVVYVDEGTTDDGIVAIVKKQTQSAFGAFRTSNVGVNTRELGAVDPSTFSKKVVDVVDPANPAAPAQRKLRVQYTYTDDAVVPKTMATRSSLSLGLLNPNYGSQVPRITLECTANDEHAHEFQSALWYVFDPSRDSCKTAMTAEQQAIDADRARAHVVAPDTLVTSEVNRLYVPMTASLTPAATNEGKSYPEYDRLYRGGVQPGKLVISQVNGLLADWAAGEQMKVEEDTGYTGFWEVLEEILRARPGFKLVSSTPHEDLTTFTAAGVTVSNVTIDQIVQWQAHRTGFPATVTTQAQRDALRAEVARKTAKHWLSFELPVTVKIGQDAPSPFVIQYNGYLGAETDSTPHKQALKNSDVVIYEGHSYIGYGPLDPTRYSAADFPSSYQMLFFNSCVSFNYYEKDFFEMKV